MRRLGPSLKLAIATALACALAALAGQHGRAEPPLNQFQPSTNTVTDAKTGLIWQKEVVMTDVTFAEAQTYCANLTLDGASSWRAPSIKELQTLVDDEKPEAPSAEQIAFPDLGNNLGFWSATPRANSPFESWHVDFGEGVAYLITVESLKAVRCVR